MKYNLDLLTIQDFPEGFQDVVELIGIESAYKLCDGLGGNPIYLPKTDSINKRLRDLSIKDEYKQGANIEQLSKKYNLSYSQLRIICNINNLR